MRTGIDVLLYGNKCLIALPSDDMNIPPTDSTNYRLEYMTMYQKINPNTKYNIKESGSSHDYNIIAGQA